MRHHLNIMFAATIMSCGTPQSATQVPPSGVRQEPRPIDSSEATRPPSQAKPTFAIGPDIHALAQRFAEYYNQRNLDAFCDMFSSQAVLRLPNGQEVRGRHAICAANKEDMDHGLTIVGGLRNLRMSGSRDTEAHSTGEYQLHDPANNKIANMEFDAQLHFSGDRWFIVRANINRK